MRSSRTFPEFHHDYQNWESKNRQSYSKTWWTFIRWNKWTKMPQRKNGKRVFWPAQIARRERNEFLGCCFNFQWALRPATCPWPKVDFHVVWRFSFAVFVVVMTKKICLTGRGWLFFAPAAFVVKSVFLRIKSMSNTRIDDHIFAERHVQKNDSRNGLRFFQECWVLSQLFAEKGPL